LQKSHWAIAYKNAVALFLWSSSHNPNSTSIKIQGAIVRKEDEKDVEM